MDRGYFKNLYPVTYINELPKIKLDPLNLPEKLKEFYTLKADIWSHQKELRLFRHKVGEYNYKPKCVKEIIFGTRTNEYEINEIISLALMNNNKIDFFKLLVKEGQYIKQKI